MILTVSQHLVPFRGLLLSPKADPILAEIFQLRRAIWRPQEEAETDETRKQIIPYVLMTADGLWLNYRRGAAGGEERLHGKVSLGVGGHVHRGDGEHPWTAYRAAAQREAAEELVLPETRFRQVIGVLYDDSTPVGRVHLGVVEVWRLAGPKAAANSKEIQEVRFSSVEELAERVEEMEIWSRHCLELLKDFSWRKLGALA